MEKYSRIIDISGSRFGLWTVLKFSGQTANKAGLFLCRCDCGVERVVASGRLRNGSSTNCGCHARQSLGDRVRTHGMHQHRLYKTWVAMRDRCRRTTHTAYPRYGGRGIYVCEQWMSFPQFVEDVGSGWDEGLTLDRIDNDGPYSPENCKWSSRKSQSRNRSNTKHLTFGLEMLPVSVWAERIGVSPNTIYLRLRKGWTIEQAVTIPHMGKR